MSVTKEQVISALSAVSKKVISQEITGKKADTNEELKSMMNSMQLKIEDVMHLSMSSYDTVKSWRVSRKSKRWRRMPDRTLAYLKVQLGRNQ
jgi:pantothenate kinase-related protein Tda10